MKLNIGCGKKLLPGWTNIDAEGPCDIVADARWIPLDHGCATKIMAIHVLEHFERWDAPVAMAEWFRLLRPAGVLILELPDVFKCCQAVVNGSLESEGFWGLYGGEVEKKNPLLMHRWGWTPAELTAVLLDVGFHEITEGTPQFHGARKQRDMRLEARKPC